ncbi:inner centromere protein isoform X2 [Excalfactoria chinensis]|uniref:inner centromere protein isoform X2 n=1 Tax=Excalfactoria chinensis TaxID=46218 RepID=UPI003B3BE2B3
MAMAAGLARLPAVCNQRLAELLRQVDDTDLVWLEEIREEAARMFGSQYNDQPELMPKTPSQKNRKRRKRSSALRGESLELGRRRLSRRRTNNLKAVSSKRYSQRLQNKEDAGPLSSEAEEPSSQTVSRRMTRSQVAASANCAEVLPEHLGERAVPVVEISVCDRISAEFQFQKRASEPAENHPTGLPPSSDDKSPKESSAAESQPLPAASELTVPHTPEAKGSGKNKSASKKTANAADTTVVLSEESGLEEVDDSAQAQKHNGRDDKEPQRTTDSPETPTGSRLSRRSVRRSLMGKPSTIRRTSLAEKYSLARKRESTIRKSIARTVIKRKAPQKLSVSSSSVNGSGSEEVPEDEETVVNAGPPPAPCTPPKPDFQGLRMSLRSQAVNKNEQQETSNKECDLNKGEKTQEPPQSARRKTSYKRAVDQRYDTQQAEDGGLSPHRKKTPSPPCPASKVVRPFKTFLHTVQKNQLLMTPCSVGRNGVIKSFIKYNTPIQHDPKEKERQKLQALRKKEEAEQLRKQKVEEEKKRRLEEAKLRREERLRKVLQARERAEQLEEERKRRIEQKLALFEEKTEKVREERLAEEKIKKRAAAKKMEEAEARRKQDEEARKQKALQQEEEERRHKELMQKKKEEEQERARKIAEQRQAEQEREKQLAAERELARKKEQERIQAEKQREQQEKAARLQKEALAAKEQIQKEVEKKENSPACNSYQMTPQYHKDPKPPKINPNNYGMDLNSDDSTDDESQPRKPIPAWASGNQLSQAVIRQYYNPPNVDALFGTIVSPKLEDIFYKSKPRYFKRTSSAVWNSPPFPGAKSVLGLPYGLKKY